MGILGFKDMVKHVSSLHLRALILAGLLCCGPWLGTAQTLSESQARLGNRIFDFHDDVSNIPSLKIDRPFIHLLDVPWLKDYIQSDPLLGDLIFMIEEKDTSITEIWPQFGTDNIYPRTTDIPEQVQLPGYETKAFENSSQWLMYLPLDRPQDYYVACTASKELIISSCTIYVSYPPDVHIWLKAPLYATDPWPEVSANFGKMADAMRQVAYCLDITDRYEPELQDGQHPTENLDAFFTNCAPVLVN